MKRSPRIGITMRLEIETRRFYLGRDYSEALAHFGAVPIHIGLIPNRKYVQNILEHLDGILLPGSDSDVDPQRFGEEPRPKLKRVVWEKDETDFLVIKEAEKLNLPVLAICFGMQALNVTRGGTLLQDIETELPDCLKHEQGLPLSRNSHALSVEDKSLLSDLAASKEVKVNSHHHQAIKTVGINLKATAWAKDGVIEGIEDLRKDKFILGVQWHPELSWKDDIFSNNIFEKFVDICGSKVKNS